jgi:hypothetical protein
LPEPEANQVKSEPAASRQFGTDINETRTALAFDGTRRGRRGHVDSVRWWQSVSGFDDRADPASGRTGGGAVVPAADRKCCGQRNRPRNGNHGTRSARLLAFDLDSGEVVHDHRLPAEIAPAGSFLQDLQISGDGRTIIIADASFWRKRPAIIVYDVETATARRVLESHRSVSAEKFIIAHEGNEMRFFGGLVALRGGIDGIALGPEWLYYGALSGSLLHRVRLRDLRNNELPPAQLARRVEEYSAKPLSDGLSTDIEGNVYVTDVEHNALFVIGEERKPRTLLRSARIRWPDALSFGPDGWLYIADSALQEVVLQPQENIEANSPYRIFRFRPGVAGVPGQ